MLVSCCGGRSFAINVFIIFNKLFYTVLHANNWTLLSILCRIYIKIMVSLFLLGESFCETSFQVELEVQKVQKQGRDENVQEDYPIWSICCVICSSCRVVFLSFFSAMALHVVGEPSCVFSSLPSSCTLYRSFLTRSVPTPRSFDANVPNRGVTTLTQHLFAVITFER